MASQISVEIRQVSVSASEALIGRHRVTIDRPTAKGGTDAGPMGGELFLAAVGGCFMSNLLAAIVAREAAVSGARVEVVGTVEGSPSRFAAVELHVSADAGDPEMLARLVEVADRGCIMINTLRGTLDLQVLISSPSLTQ